MQSPLYLPASTKSSIKFDVCYDSRLITAILTYYKTVENEIIDTQKLAQTMSQNDANNELCDVKIDNGLFLSDFNIVFNQLKLKLANERLAAHMALNYARSQAYEISKLNK